MAQGVNTVRPVAGGAGEILGDWTVTGAATASDALRDDSNSSYVTSPAVSGLDNLRIPIAAPPAVPSNQSCIWARVRVKLDDTGGGSSAPNVLEIDVGIYYHYGIGSPTYIFYLEDNFHDPGGTPTTLTGQQNPTNPSTGGLWTVSTTTGSGDFSTTRGGTIDYLQISTNWFSGMKRYKIYEVYVDYFYDNDPAPTYNSVTNLSSLRPTVLFNHVDTENDTYDRIQVAWYNSAQYGAGGFVAGSAPYDAFTDFTTAPSTSSPIQAQPGSDLTNGLTYKAYMRVEQTVSGYKRWSAWVASTAFTIAANAPAIPTLAATIDNTLGRVQLAVQARDNMLTYNESDIETDTSGWAVAANCTLSRITAQFNHGAASMQLASAAAGAFSATTPTGVNGVPVTAGETYTALAAFRRISATANRNVHVDIKWYTAAGALISTSAGATSADSNAAWTAVTNTAMAPGTAAFAAVVVQVDGAAAAAEQHAVDTISFAPGSATTWTAGSMAPGAGFAGPNGGAGHQISIERSTDGGATWTVIRPQTASTASGSIPQSAISSTTGKATVYDYEAPLGTSLLYRARTIITYAAGDAGNPSSTGSSTIPGSYTANAGPIQLSAPAGGYGFWLKDPLVPSNNMEIDIIDRTFDLTFPLQQAVFNALGRPDPIVVSDVADLTLGRATFEILTDANWVNFRDDLFKSLHTLLLQKYDGQQWYIRFNTNGQLHEYPGSAPVYRTFDAKWTEVVAP